MSAPAKARASKGKLAKRSLARLPRTLARQESGGGWNERRVKLRFDVIGPSIVPGTTIRTSTWWWTISADTAGSGARPISRRRSGNRHPGPDDGSTIAGARRQLQTAGRLASDVSATSQEVRRRCRSASLRRCLHRSLFRATKAATASLTDSHFRAEPICATCASWHSCPHPNPRNQGSGWAGWIDHERSTTAMRAAEDSACGCSRRTATMERRYADTGLSQCGGSSGRVRDRWRSRAARRDGVSDFNGRNPGTHDDEVQTLRLNILVDAAIHRVNR